MVHTLFPLLPTAAITADLQRTGSVETTVDNVNRAGGLPMPVTTMPSSYQPNSSGKHIQYCNLLQRYKLEGYHLIKDTLSEPPKVWETDALKRQEALKKRKEYMVLQARKKLLERQEPQSIDPLPLYPQEPPAQRQPTGGSVTIDSKETTTPTCAP
ncbi:hypothetical protein [Absidia glauca]|uniref:CUE domain-containing protein n=1 Tax=Absidia glauca TaxID=4829 RepID=A0A163IX35_ABSGL|nr:hypothetical protein [Absidia glauca]